MSDTNAWNAGSMSWAGNDSSYNMSAWGNSGNGAADAGFDGSSWGGVGNSGGCGNGTGFKDSSGSMLGDTSSSMWSGSNGTGCGCNGAALLANASSSMWTGNGDGCGCGYPGAVGDTSFDGSTSMLANASSSMWTGDTGNIFGCNSGWDAAGYSGGSGGGMAYNGSSWGGYDGSGGGSASGKGGKRGRRFENSDNSSWGYDNSKGGRRAGGKHGRRYEDSSSWGGYDGSGGGSATKRGRRFGNINNSWGYGGEGEEEVAWVAQAVDELKEVKKAPWWARSRCFQAVACKSQVRSSTFLALLTRVCVVGGPTLDGLETAMMKIVDLIKKIYELANSKNSKMVLKFIVPKSVASILIGPGGATIQKLTGDTGCRINMSQRMEGFQERVMVMSGEEDALRAAVVEVLRTIQGDEHLEENMNLVYTQEVPMGSWSGESNEPADPEWPLMSPEEAETKTKRELVEYLNRAAPRDVLVRMKLLGRTKNAVKSTAQPDFLDAVKEVCVSRGGHTLPPRPPVEAAEQVAVPTIQPLRPGPVQADAASETSSDPSEAFAVPAPAAAELEAEAAESEAEATQTELPPLMVLAAALEKMEKAAVLPTPTDESTGSSRLQEGQPEEEPQTRSAPEEASEATSRPPQLMAIGRVGAPLVQDDDDVNPQEQGPKEFCQSLVDSLVGCVLGHPAATADHSLEVCEELIPPSISTRLQSVAKQLSDEERLLLAVADMHSGVTPCIEVPSEAAFASSSSSSGARIQGDEQARIKMKHDKFLCQPDEGKVSKPGDPCTAPGDAQSWVDFRQLSRLWRRLYRRLF